MSAERFRSLIARVERFDLLLMAKPEFSRFLVFVKMSKLLPDAELDALFDTDELDIVESLVIELEVNVKAITDELS